MSEIEQDVANHIDKKKCSTLQEQDVSIFADKCDQEEKNNPVQPTEINDNHVIKERSLEHAPENKNVSDSNLEHSEINYVPNSNKLENGEEESVGRVIVENNCIHLTSILEDDISTALDVSSKKLSGSTDVFIYDKKLGNGAFGSQEFINKVDKQRRSSLPDNRHSEVHINNIVSNSHLDSNISVSSHNVNINAPKLPSLNSERVKVAPNLNNITDVVKNVHGLFSSLKNAYKDKNIGDIMMATQKNFISARNGYLNLKPERISGNDGKLSQSTKDVSETLNKYSTLNLLNENQDFENSLFSKCENFPGADKKCTSTESNKNSYLEHTKTKEVNSIFVLDTDDTGIEDTSCSNSTDCIDNTFGSTNNAMGSVDSEINHRNITDGDISKTAHDGLHSMENISNLNLESRENNKVLNLGCEKAQENIEKNIELENNMSVLEATVLEQNKEIDSLRNKLFQRDAAKKCMEVKLAEVSKQLEATVMRYAVSERTAIAAERSRSVAVSSEARAKEEAAVLERRLRTANTERTRICDMLDVKSHELSNAQREASRLREELQACDTKLKWAQNKLLSEIEAHKEASSLAEKLGQQVAQHELTSGNVPPVQQPQSTEIDVQMKEKEASAILERHERQRLEGLCKQLQGELEQLRQLQTSTVMQCRELKAQAESNAGEAAALRDSCSELRSQAARDCERLAAAQARAARLDTLTAHLQQEQEKCERLQQELEMERKGRAEAQAEAGLGARREAELLRQVERLTQSGVILQARCSEAEAKALALSVDNGSLRTAADREAERHATARAEAERERAGREADARALAAAAARHQRAERQALQRLEQLEGEACVTATKHASAIKELKREIHQWKRKCEKMEKESPPVGSVPSKPSQRTGSCSSLSSFEGSSSSHQTPHTDSLEPILDVQVDRQQLVERIVHLQRAGARHRERVEFLEGHAATLTAELQRKSRLLRAMALASPSGALTAPASDRSKAEIGRHGGIMASLFNHEVTDDTMTLDLSVEINAKLQSVLEDTLLKNITLKENMDTLGDEITRLKEELHRRCKK